MTASSSPVRLDIDGRIATIVIDNPPVNVISQAVRQGLLQACDTLARAVAEGSVDRVILTGAGRAFVAGADAREFDGPPLEPHLPDVLAALMPLPAVAAINGAALGGGLELALACRARVAHPKAVIGLPEVTLGVVPGAGGTQRLPRLIGLEKALPLVSTGQTVKGPEAEALGIVDACAEDVMAAARDLDASLLARPSLDDAPAPAAAPAAVAAARSHAQKRLRGQIAPLRAIDLMEKAASLPIAEGLQAERDTFLELRKGPQARALRHVFFAERGAGASASLRAIPPAEISRALVAGGGTMGSAIAYALASVGVHVTLLEHDAGAEARAQANIRKLYDEAVKRGKMAAPDAERHFAESYSFVHGAETALPPVDLAVEAVFEDLAVKRALLQRFADQLPATTILATNTSYLDVNAIAQGLAGPERFLGLHFFAPAHLMKLVEVIRAHQTSAATLATTFALTKRLGKIAVEAGVCDGFIGNRILTRYRHTADIALIEGALPEQVDAAMEAFGMAMGPYAVQDLSGLDIAYANRKRKRDAGIAIAGRPVPIADAMVDDLNRLGRKTGRGWYDHADGKATPSAEVTALVTAASASAGITRRSFTEEEIAHRLALSMIAEAADILQEGIANRPADIDLVLVHGYGFPRWRGGPMCLADTWGLDRVAADLQTLAVEDPLTWRVPPLVSRLAAEGRNFASLND